MIFVTVGNDFRNFDRLLKKMDEIAPVIQDDMMIQRGYSRYLLKNATYFDFVSMNQAIAYIQRSQLVVSHAGIGTIILCKKHGIPMLMIPRRKTYGEHMNDHQLEIAKAMENKEKENIYVVYEEDQLKETILKILTEGKRDIPMENTGTSNLIRVIKEFLEHPS